MFWLKPPRSTLLAYRQQMFDMDRWKQQAWDDAQEIMRLRETLEEIADGPDRHDAVQSIKKAKRALGHRASPRKDPADVD